MILAAYADTDGMIVVRPDGAVVVRYGDDIPVQVQASRDMFSEYEYVDVEMARKAEVKVVCGTPIIRAIRKVMYHDNKRQRRCYFRKKPALKLKRREAEYYAEED